MAALLTRAGYKLLTGERRAPCTPPEPSTLLHETNPRVLLLAVDVDEITVPYPDALTLMHELRGMGEGNAVHMRRRAPPCTMAPLCRATRTRQRRPF